MDEKYGDEEFIYALSLIEEENEYKNNEEEEEGDYERNRCK